MTYFEETPAQFNEQWFEKEEKEDYQNFYPFDNEQNINLFNQCESALIGEENHLIDDNNNLEEPFFFISPNFDIVNALTVKTEPTSVPLLNQKRIRDKNDCFELVYENIIIDCNKDKNDKNTEEEKLTKKEKKTKKEAKTETGTKTMGRRKKNEFFEEEAEHNKFRQDNMMRKIKTFNAKYILEILNNNLIDKKHKFYPLDAKLNENLKKDFNEKLLETKIYELFENFEMNKKTKRDENTNKILISKIFQEKIETKVIAILNMTYKDILDLIREKDSENFLGKIRKKETKNNKNFTENVEFYMQEIKSLLYQYEDWFGFKLGRNVEKEDEKNSTKIKDNFTKRINNIRYKKQKDLSNAIMNPEIDNTFPSCFLPKTGWSLISKNEPVVAKKKKGRFRR